MIGRLLIVCGFAICLAGLTGCSAGNAGKASETDRANIERLAREGVGAPKSPADEER
ncbi:MAG: hypothetical protein SNJ76_03145 [Fimbriimonadaceae bacterium]